LGPEGAETDGCMLLESAPRLCWMCCRCERVVCIGVGAALGGHARPLHPSSLGSDFVFRPILQPDQGLTVLKVDFPLSVSPDIKVI
jgi:hypothetical protein